jgi:hypothetical protein
MKYFIFLWRIVILTSDGTARNIRLEIYGNTFCKKKFSAGSMFTFLPMINSDFEFLGMLS